MGPSTSVLHVDTAYGPDNSDSLVRKSYKTLARTASSSNPVQFEITLDDRKEASVTVFILAAAEDLTSANKMGGTQIVVINEGVETIVKDNVYDTGFYELGKPYVQAESILFRRVSNGNNMNYELAHTRVYQIPNLLQFGAQIYYQTPAIDSQHSAENLVQNL